MAAKAESAKADAGVAIPWRIVGLAVLGLVFVVFWHNPLLLPAKLLVVMFHELSHAIACWATGGSVDAIGLAANQGGVTQFRGGWQFVIANAGYVGSLLWGIGLLRASRSARANLAVGGLAVLLGIVAVLFVRPLISFGFVFTLAMAAVLGAVSRYGGKVAASPVLDALGVFSVLYALFDIRDDILLGGSGDSDAAALASMTMIPAVVWGVGWLAVGVGALYVTRKWWA